MACSPESFAGRPGAQYRSQALAQKLDPAFIEVVTPGHDLRLVVLDEVRDDFAIGAIFVAVRLALLRTALSTKSPGLPCTASAGGTIASTIGPIEPGSLMCFSTTSVAAAAAPEEYAMHMA